MPKIDSKKKMKTKIEGKNSPDGLAVVLATHPPKFHLATHQRIPIAFHDPLSLVFGIEQKHRN